MAIVFIPFLDKLEDGIFAMLGDKAMINVKPWISFTLKFTGAFGLLIYINR